MFEIDFHFLAGLARDVRLLAGAIWALVAVLAAATVVSLLRRK